MSEPSDTRTSVASGFWSAIESEMRQAEKELREGKELRVIVRTPTGSVEATALDSLDPEVIIAHSERDGHRTTLIAPIEAVQVIIEVRPREEKKKPRPIGFRLPD